ncbi:MAG: TadE/TadG family type IV pilus assembly protein [Dehalococcoidia bacterium]|nr:TadE/TadG family type IV pilus assembly protein [Dehalococcoidia bacterium]
MRGRSRRGERAQSLVEFALLAPVLIILMLGIIDYGRVYFAYISVTNGARTGADYAATGPTAASDLAGIKNAATAETSELLNTSPTNPNVSAAIGTDGQGRTYADVTVEYTFTTLFPWPGLPSSIDMERTVRASVAE